MLLARIDYLRRKGKEAYPETRETFKASQELIASYFPGWVDHSLAFVMYEAKCALRLGDGISEARSVWNAALRTPLNKYASAMTLSPCMSHAASPCAPECAGVPIKKIHIMVSCLVHSISRWPCHVANVCCRFMNVWTAFISMEVAEQNLDAARGIYRRCYSHVLEDGGQVCWRPTTCLSYMADWGRFQPPLCSLRKHIRQRSRNGTLTVHVITNRCTKYRAQGQLHRGAHGWEDLQAALCQAWVRFEHEHGSAEDHLQALLKTTPIVERAAAEAMAAANAEAAAVAQARSPCLPPS